MVDWETITTFLGRYIPILRTLAIVIVSYLVFSFIIRFVKKRLLNKAKTKKQKSNIEIFSKIFKYVVLVVLVVIAVFSYGGSWTGFGVSVGLFSAALGWALQKPITGIAAWLMVVVRRPFDVGDRVLIGDVKGDVEDISLTHIYLKEIGGLIATEENSGRTIMVPNSVLFEKNIINYTLQDEYVLDQVTVTVTYESDLNKAIKMAVGGAKKITKKFDKETGKEPYVRTYFQPSGINVHVRYFCPAQKLQEVSSAITQEVFKQYDVVKDVEIAYPHTEVLLRKKENIKRKKR